MFQITVEAQRREPGGKNANRRLRSLGKIPAVLYGPGREPVAVVVQPKAVLDVLYSETGHNTIFKMKVDSKKNVNAMVKNYQLDPVRGNLIHADFMQIAMDQILELTVAIEVVGEAEGVRLGGGIMDMVSREIEVECLPADIPESIKVDVSHLNINDYIRVKDLTVGPKVKILSDPEVVVVTIAPPIKEEEEVPVEAPVEATEPEVIKKGKAEEEEEPGKAPQPESKEEK